MLQHVAVGEHAFRSEEDVVGSGLGGEDCIVRAVRRGLFRQNLRVAAVDSVEIGGADLRGGILHICADQLAFAIADDCRRRHRSRSR